MLQPIGRQRTRDHPEEEAGSKEAIPSSSNDSGEVQGLHVPQVVSRRERDQNVGGHQGPAALAQLP